MRSKLLCAVSLLLNVALAGYWLKFRVAAAVRVPAVESAQARVSGPGPAPRRRSFPMPASPQAKTGTQPSPWSRIESADFPTFVANLRSTGCPERTVRDIVVPEVDALFKDRSKAGPEPDDHWLTADMAEERSRARRIAEWNSERGRRDLLRSLFGVEGSWPKDIERDPDEWAGFCALLTPPTFEAAERMVWVMDRTRFEHEGIMAEAAYPLTFSEIEELGRLRDRSFAEVVGIVGQARIDEALGLVRVAMMTIKEMGFWERSDPAAGFSDAEARRLVAAQPRDLTAVDEVFDFQDVGRLERFRAGLPKDESREMKAAFLESVVAALGADRVRDLSARLEPGWLELSRFTDEAKLPRATAGMLVDAQALAVAEAERIRADVSLTAEAEADGLRAVADQVMEAIGQQLPPEALNAYLEKHSKWLEELRSGKGEDE